MLLDCFSIDWKIFVICSPVKNTPNLATQAFLRYRRNSHCRQARRFDCVPFFTCQKLKFHVQGNRLKAIRRTNASQVSLMFIFKTLSYETFLSFQFSMFFNGKVKKVMEFKSARINVLHIAVEVITISVSIRHNTNLFFTVSNLATILQIKSPVPKFYAPWRLKWSQLGGLAR